MVVQSSRNIILASRVERIEILSPTRCVTPKLQITVCQQKWQSTLLFCYNVNVPEYLCCLFCWYMNASVDRNVFNFYDQLWNMIYRTDQEVRSEDRVLSKCGLTLYFHCLLCGIINILTHCE